jgi:hypothetical protein
MMFLYKVSKSKIDKMLELNKQGKTSKEIAEIVELHRVTVESYLGHKRERKIKEGVRGVSSINIDNSLIKKKRFLDQIKQLELGSSLKIVSRGYSFYDRKPILLEGTVFNILKDKFFMKSGSRIYMFTILDFMGNDCKII